MKKIMLMSTTIILTTLLCVVPFSVNASTSLFNATSGTIDNYDNTQIGRYNVYTATATGANLQFYFMDQFFDYDQFKSASITDIQLNDSFDNYMTIIYGSNVNDDLVWVESDGSALLHINQTAVNLTLNDVSWVRIFVVSTDSTPNNIQPTSISPTLTKSLFNVNLDPVLNNQIIQRWFPNVNMVGYLWGISYGAYNTNYYDANIPVVYIQAGNNTYDQMHRLVAKANSTTVFYFYCTWWLDSSRYRVLYDNSSVNFETSIEIVQQPGAVNTGTYSPYYLTKFTIINPTTDNRRFELEFTGNVYVTPIYFGDANQIPDDLALMLQIDYNNTYTRLLQEIANSLAAQGDPNTSSDIEDTSNDLSDISEQINTITDAVDVDFNNNINNIDLDDHDFFTGLTNTTNYFKIYVQDFYNNIGDVKALLIVPVIVTIMMMIAGWMF